VERNVEITMLGFEVRSDNMFKANCDLGLVMMMNDYRMSPEVRIYIDKH
jgi:hypothetical protein